MRNLIFIFTLFFVTSCSDDEVPRFEVRIDIPFTIPAGLNTLEAHYITLRNVPTKYFQNLNLNNVDSSIIRNINSSLGSISGRFSNIDFDFIQQISVTAVSRENPLLKAEMYYLDFVPFETDFQLKMLSSTTELKNVINSDAMDLEIRMVLRQFTSSKLETSINFGYVVFTK